MPRRVAYLALAVVCFAGAMPRRAFAEPPAGAVAAAGGEPARQAPPASVAPAPAAVAIVPAAAEASPGDAAKSGEPAKSAEPGRSGDGAAAANAPGDRHHGHRKGPAAEPTGEDTAKRVRGNSRLRIRARELKLSEARAATLGRIADAYFAHTHTALVATGGTRTPLRQAQLMVEKFRHHDDVAALYENAAALSEIQKIFEDGKATHQPRARTERAIASAIEAQVARGVYISRHLQFGAVDIRSRGMTANQEAAFRAAVGAETGVTLLDERNGPEPHFHLSL